MLFVSFHVIVISFRSIPCGFIHSISLIHSTGQSFGRWLAGVFVHNICVYMYNV